MEEYLIDRETLEKFVDELMKKRPLPIDSAEELSNYKEQLIKTLDDRIGLAIFGNLNESQSNEVEKLLNDENAGPDSFRDFFQTQNIDIEKTITDAMEAFSQEFLEGGQNA